MCSKCPSSLSHCLFQSAALTVCIPFSSSLPLSLCLSPLFLFLSPFLTSFFYLSPCKCLPLPPYFFASLYTSLPPLLRLSFASLLSFSFSPLSSSFCVCPSATASLPLPISFPVPLSLFYLCPFFSPFLTLVSPLDIHIASSASDAGKQSHLHRVSTHAWHDFLLLISVSRVAAAAAAAAV